MSASVRPESGGWRGYCRECGAVKTGDMAAVDLWADVHNEENHKEAEQIFCPAQTYAVTRGSPAEYCTEEVADYGDLCAKHDQDDRADELYEAYLEAKHERETDPENYYRDFGD